MFFSATSPLSRAIFCVYPYASPSPAERVCPHLHCCFLRVTDISYSYCFLTFFVQFLTEKLICCHLSIENSEMKSESDVEYTIKQPDLTDVPTQSAKNLADGTIIVGENDTSDKEIEIEKEDTVRFFLLEKIIFDSFDEILFHFPTGPVTFNSF